MARVSNARILTLIAAKPGLMRDSLLAFLRAISEIEIGVVVSASEAVVSTVRRHRAHTLIMDATLSEEASLLQLVRLLKAERPALNCVVLANSLRQQRAFLSAGTDHVLLKGHLDARLRIAVVGVPDLVAERELPEDLKT